MNLHSPVESLQLKTNLYVRANKQLRHCFDLDYNPVFTPRNIDITTPPFRIVEFYEDNNFKLSVFFGKQLKFKELVKTYPNSARSYVREIINGDTRISWIQQGNYLVSPGSLC